MSAGIGRFRRPHLVHAARVALVATLVIGVVYVAAAALFDALVARRVLFQVDQRLSDRLVDLRRFPVPPQTPAPPNDDGTDGAPVYVWWASTGGPVRSLTAGAPSLPAAVRSSGGPVSSDVPDGAVTGRGRPVPASYRFDSIRLDGGRLVTGQSLASPAHIEHVLLLGELVLGPVLLASLFVGVLVIAVQAVAPVEDARRRQLEFTADASHELRTPLTVIEAEVELARSGPADADEHLQTLERVARESQRLKRIVEDLLWLARFDAEPPPPPSIPADLSAVAEACAERFRAVAQARQIRLSTPTSPVPVWVEVAPEWIDRLAGTLIDNACRYTPAGGEVRVSVAAVGSRAVLTVDDSGPGIPVDDRDRLFDRFHRASNHPEGSGLGLAIADSVVRRTGGRWRIGESPSGGASMEVSWRRRAEPPPGRRPAPRDRDDVAVEDGGAPPGGTATGTGGAPARSGRQALR
ncbi:MAG: sensor histidine kinase [Acidimicrobiales bacterium]